MMVKTKVETIYRCAFCGMEYNNFFKAEECFDRGLVATSGLKVGDIVMLGTAYRFGWYDGDPDWIEGSIDGKSCSGKLHRFYYVVTVIDSDSKDKHRARYHLFTGAMTGRNGHHEGYTYDEHHYTPSVVENAPPDVVKKSKQYIGMQAQWLI